MSELFKYRSDAGPHVFDILENHRMHFCAPKEFNDPFDSAIHFDYSDVSSTYMKKAAKKFSEDLGGNRKLRRNGKKSLFRGMTKQKNDVGSVGYKNQTDFVNRTIGIFCLSSLQDNLIMWAHYANSHKGFCIGFHQEKIEAISLLESRLMPIASKSMIELRKVEYSQVYPIVNPEILGEEDKLYIPLTTKSKHWEYEKEHRLIYTNGVGKYLEFGEGVISRVILGVNAGRDTEMRVKEHLKSWKERAPLFKAHMKKREFALEFSSVTY